MRQEEKPPSIYDLLSRRNCEQKSSSPFHSPSFSFTRFRKFFCAGNESPSNFQSCLPIVAFIFFQYRKTHEFRFFKVKNDFLAMIYWPFELLGLKRFTLDCSCCKTFNAPPIMSPNHESPTPDDFTKVQSNAMKTTSIFLKIVQKWVH